jgi:hypothetical protein
MKRYTKISLHDLPEKDHYTAQQERWKQFDWLRKV